MPYMTNGKRDYKREYAKYQGKPEQIKNRSKRNQARATMAKAGKVKKGDGKDVAHKQALSKSGLNILSNLKVESASGNRSFSRNKNSSLKSEVSKRERKK